MPDIDAEAAGILIANGVDVPTALARSNTEERRTTAITLSAAKIHEPQNRQFGMRSRTQQCSALHAAGSSRGPDL